MTSEIDDLTAAIAADPADAWLYWERGRLYREAGKHGLAVEDFGRAVALEPDEPQFWRSRGLLYESMGYVSESRADLDHAVGLDPADAESYAVRGWCSKLNRDLVAALADLDRAVDLEPLDPTYRLRRGLILLGMERLADALGDFDEAIQLDPEEPRFRQERALALLYHDPDVRPERALPDLEEAIRLRPDRDWYYEDRGYILFQQGRWREAAEDFTRPDFRRISRFCPHRGAERVVWIDLARRLEGRPDLGARAIREFLDWYLGESEGWLTNRPVEQKLETWPVPLARFLAGDVDEERLIAGCRTYFDPADPDPGGESEGVAHRIMECHFVLAARFLALGLPERAEMHLREADGLPARNPMSWFVKHRLGR